MESFFQCAKCRKDTLFHRMYTIGKVHICANCADELTFVCEDCGQRFWRVSIPKDENEILCCDCHCRRAEQETDYD